MGMNWSMEGALKAMEEVKVIQSQMLRSWSEAIEKVKCNKCGSNPTLTNSGSGDTLQLCTTLYEAMKRQADSVGRGMPGPMDLLIDVTPCDATFPEFDLKLVNPDRSGAAEEQ